MWSSISFVGEREVPERLKAGMLKRGWIKSDDSTILSCFSPQSPCGRFDEAARIFERMLWLNPSDNQGVRFLIEEVQAKTAWEDRHEKR